MKTAEWSLQEAKNKFSAVVDAARSGTPQVVTRRGRPAVVVLASEDYERLQRLDAEHAPSFADHLLALPQAPHEPEASHQAVDLRLRDVEF